MSKGTPAESLNLRVVGWLQKLNRARSDSARERAVGGIVRASYPGMPGQLEQYYAERPEKSVDFLLILARLIEKGDAEALPPLGHFLGDERAAARNNAARIVTNHRLAEHFIPELEKLTRDQDEMGPFLETIRALEASPSPETQRVLTELWTRGVKGDFRRGHALRALAHYGDPALRPTLETIFADEREHPYTRRMAAYGLARLGDFDKARLLRTELDSKDEGAWRAAAEALFHLTSRERDFSPTGRNRLRKWWDENLASVKRRIEGFRR